MNKVSKILSFVSISLLIVINAHGQDWNVSAEQKAMTLGVEFTEEIQDEGNSIYNKSCKMCHGDVVVAPSNDRVLPVAPNLGATDWQAANTDGEIFAKITNGQGGMPPFAGSLSDDERWKVTAFIRANYEAYVPANVASADAPKKEKFKGTIKGIEANYDDTKKDFTVKLIAVDENGAPAKAEGIKLDFYVTRHFGNMALAEGVRSDKNGELTVDVSEIISAFDGSINIIAQTSDKAFKNEQTVTIAEAREWVNPLDERQIWGRSAKAPLWLMISYLTVTLTTLSVLGWAGFQLFRIWNLRER